MTQAAAANAKAKASASASSAASGSRASSEAILVDAGASEALDVAAQPAEVDERRRLSAERRERVKHLPWMGASCLLDGGVLALYCAIGAVPWWIAGLFFAASAVLILISWGLLRSGFTERFRDPYISAYQLSVTALSMAAAAALAPAAAFHFYNVLLVVFTFGALRLSVRQTLVAGSVVLAAVASVMALHADRPLLAPTAASTAIAWLSYATVLSRCLLVGLYGSSLRGRLRRRNEQLAESSARIAQLASHDELTGVLNRRAVWALLEGHATPPAGDGGRLCVALLDLDHFKQVNDSFGHPAGDEVLRRFGRLVKGGLRGGDRIGRYGGEEFLLLLPRVELATAGAVVERLRQQVEGAAWDDVTPGRIVTMSAGVADWHPGDTVADLVARADAALYRAKAAGRNRVERG